MNKLRRNGMLQQLLYVTKHRNEVQETPFVSIDMTSLAPIFTVLAFGTVGTILCLSLEFAIYKWRKHKQITEFIMTECFNVQSYFMDMFIV
jgi:hypothetical protein